MNKTFETAGYRCLISTPEKGVKAPSQTVYLLWPMPVTAETSARLAEHYACGIAFITGIDWDNDLTPWRAPGVFQRDAPFEGKAQEFLDNLTRVIVPAIDKAMNLTPEFRTLAGISLSGLFATWQWIESPFFNNVISISGSFWYDGFTTWLRSAPIPPRGGKIYLSLGDAEEDTTVARFQPVKRCTDEVADILRRAGIDVVYKMTKGNHYAPPVPRLMAALDSIIG